jgi:drug/metabolite transporter (DMT)-like permease
MRLAAAFAVAWVVLEGVVGARLQGRYSLMQVVWCRYAVHLAALLLLWGWRRPAMLWRTRRPVYQLARSMLMLVMPLSFALALQSGTPPGTVWAVFWSSPLLILVFARWMLAERPRWWHWTSASLGTIAAAGMLVPSQPVAAPLLLLPAAMALSFSVYVVMTRSLRSETVRANLFYTALGVFLALTPFVPGIWVTPSVTDALLLIAIGLLGLVTLFVLDRSAACAPVSKVAPVFYVHLVCLAALAFLVGGEIPSRRTLAGGLLIAAIVWYLWARASRKSSEERIE